MFFAYFNQRLACAAPKRWSKYTTRKAATPCEAASRAQRAISLQNVHQLGANACQNCGLLVR